MAAHLNPRRHALAVAGLVLAVGVMHLATVEWVARQVGPLSGLSDMPARIQVAYVREMELAPPPVHVVAPRPARRRVAPPVVPVTEVPPPPEAPRVGEEPPAPEPAPAVAEAPAPPANPEAKPFEWPVSTRLRYDLTGDYRGEVHGDAQVEWILVGTRYQVRLDVSVGLLASRRMSSDGEITPQGLSPRRYDQETQVAFNTPYRSTVRFEVDQVLLANGQVVPRWPGVQDTVSQFVQLSFMFGNQPQLLRVGQRVEMPLAMPRNVSTWAYDVVEEETLYTPFGEVQAFHLKPLREPRAGGDMTVDIWIAPQLRHLPVRFRIRPDPEAYFDLMLDRRPELAASEPTAPRNPP
ncbi:MAG TPA: DUF3108 domain-containing protein [Rhizobacter sp.]|nr:DUF3108 domain-containing protein [Rhizobacter sp.]